MARLNNELSRALAEPAAAAEAFRAWEGRLGALEDENREFRKAVQRAEGHKGTIGWQNDELVR